MTSPAIQIDHVHKRYGKLFRGGSVDALRGVSMHVQRGEIFGLLGPNGAGKSTLIKILLTVVKPTKCSGTVLGKRVGHTPTLAKIGYLPEHHSFPKYLTGKQIIDYTGALTGTRRKIRRAKSDELLELVGMRTWAAKKIGSYSKGMRQRIGIAQALVNNPELVLLDEPTDGVDPVGRRDIRDITKRLSEEGRTVFLNSHLLTELEAVCDRVAIMVQGQIERQGTLDELTEGQRRYEIELHPTADLDQSLVLVAAACTVETSLDNRTRTLRVATEDANAVQPAIDVLREHHMTIRSVRPVRPSLEDLFLQAVTDPATGKSLAPGAAQKSSRSGKGGDS